MGKIHIAAYDGDLATVKKLVESGEYFFSDPVPVDIGYEPPMLGSFFEERRYIGYGDTPLDCAMQNNHFEIVKYLHEKGAKKYDSVYLARCKCVAILEYMNNNMNLPKDAFNLDALISSGSTYDAYDAIEYIVRNTEQSKEKVDQVLSKIMDGLSYTIAAGLNKEHSKKENIEKRTKKAIKIIRFLINIVGIQEISASTKKGIGKALEIAARHSNIPFMEFLFDEIRSALYRGDKGDFLYYRSENEAGNALRIITENIWGEKIDDIDQYISVVKDLMQRSNAIGLFDIRDILSVKEKAEEIFDFAIDLVKENQNFMNNVYCAIINSCCDYHQVFLERCKIKQVLPLDGWCKVEAWYGKTISADRQGPLVASVAHSNLDAIKFLIKNGADLDVVTSDGLTLLEVLEAKKKYLERVERETNTTDEIIRYLTTEKKRLEEERHQETVRKLLELQIQLQAANNSNNDKKASASNNNNTNVNNAIDSMGQISLSLEIAYEDLTLGKKLSQGGFGTVYQAVWQHSDVAVKQLSINNLSDAAEVEFKNEASVMAKLRNPHIIQLYGVCTTVPYCLVMELATKGSLHAVLHSNAEIDWPMRLKIAQGAAKGLAFLHNQKPVILHRDIKSMNVLLDDAMTPKLTDFGLAKIKDTAAAFTTRGGAAGTLHWMAPEILDEGAHTAASDVYSLAILLWEIASRKLPYEGKRAQQIITFVLQDKRETIPNDCPAKFGTLITNCWAPKPEERYTTAQVIQDLEAQRQELNTSNATTDKSGYMSFS